VPSVGEERMASHWAGSIDHALAILPVFPDCTASQGLRTLASSSASARAPRTGCSAHSKAPSWNVASTAWSLASSDSSWLPHERWLPPHMIDRLNPAPSSVW
jgi:hypothetical protein